GYTLLVGAMDTHVINPTLYGKRVPFHGIDDFQPVDMLAYAAVVLAVHPGVPAQNVAELIALAKGRPGQLRFTNAGAGSNSHLLTVLLERRTGIDTQRIPHRGSAAAVSEVAGGNADVVFSAWTVIEPYVRSGRLRPLAVTTRDKAASLPALPTVAETVPGFDLGIYYGLFAARGTPREIVERLNFHANALIDRPAVRARLLEQGLEPVRRTPEQFEKQLRDDYARWSKLIPELNIEPEPE
ncbi:MAG: Bug family tripartite tricarboxylate transporter substrate binding protein, partial [Burkholderiales bacterium]